jgi:hypothetical protein
MNQTPALHHKKTHRYPDVVLIGPAGAGKTTIGMMLAERLGLPSICLDEIAEPYYEERGFGQAVTQRLMKEQGFASMYRQLAPALAHATVRMIEDHDHGVLDLGAGHSHFADAGLFNQVKHALAPCPHVILLLPSPDLNASVQVLRARSLTERGWDWNADGYDYIEHWVKDACNHELATLTVYTHGQTPKQICDAILHHLQNAPHPTVSRSGDLEQKDDG